MSLSNPGEEKTKLNQKKVSLQFTASLPDKLLCEKLLYENRY